MTPYAACTTHQMMPEKLKLCKFIVIFHLNIYFLHIMYFPPLFTHSGTFSQTVRPTIFTSRLPFIVHLMCIAVALVKSAITSIITGYIQEKSNGCVYRTRGRTWVFKHV